MGIQIVVFTLGLVGLIWPQVFEPLSRRQHARRLEALKAGAPEAFFEEQRSLEAYPPAHRSLMGRRLLGGLMVLAATGAFLWDRLG
jgi:hypothetical protein